MKPIIKFYFKLIILIFILLNNLVICSAQHFPNDGPHTSTPYVNTYIDAPQPAHMTDYKGRDEVKLKPGTIIPPNSLVYLEPSIQADVTYNSNPNAGFGDTLPDLNKDLDVGSIPGQANVNLMGGASYTIPLDFPKGSGGVAPQISLTYNSNGGMGIAGLGWNLNGLHAITRGGRNMADDGKVQGISLLNQDCFLFDGARLFPVGENGIEGTEYHSQHESFSVIKSHANNIYDGPTWWEITTKDGTKIEIGNTANSKLNFQQIVQVANPGYLAWADLHPLSPSSQNPHDEEIDQEINANVMWMITKIADPNGNFVTFEYDNKNNTEIVLTKIVYAGNNAATPAIVPDCEINFYYSLTAFPNTVNLSLKRINNTVILRKIETKVSNQIYNSYNFEYAQKHIWEFLTSIQKSNRFGQKLNPTYFQYGDISDDTEGSLNKNIGGVYNQGFDASGKDFFFLDFDGDGLKDMVGITTVPVPSSFNIIKMYKNIGDFKFDEIHQQVATGGPSSQSFSSLISVEMACSTVVSMPTVVDFNGDGKEDLFIETIFDFIDNNGNVLRNFTYVVLLSTGSSFIVQTVFNNSLNPLLADSKALVGDGDGDGKSDIIQLSHNSNLLTVNKVDIDNLTEFNTPLTPNFGTDFSGDYNVKSAFLIPLSGTARCGINGIVKCNTSSGSTTCATVGFEYHNSNSEFSETHNSYANVSDCNNPIFNSYFGDFNGDGFMDTYIDAFSNTDVIKTNFGGYTLNNNASAGIVSYDCDKKVYTADINGDGKTDFVEARKIGSETGIYVTYSTGVSFTGSSNSTTTLINSLQILSNKVDFIDIDGDGNLDMIFTPKHTNQDWIYVVNFKTTLSQVAMKLVKNGLGKINKFNYTKGHEIIKNDADANFPNTIIGFTYKFVHTIESSNGIGGFFKNEYAYENPIFNREGKGFLGYKKTIVKDRVNNLMQTVSSKLLAGTLSGTNSRYAFLLPEKNEAYKIDNLGAVIGTALKRSETTYELVPLTTYTEITHPFLSNPNFAVNINRKTYLLKTKTTDQYDLLANTYNHKIITTNNDGNVTKTETDVNGLETQVTDIEYNSWQKETWVPYLPFVITKTKTVGNNSLINRTNYQYNAEHRLETELHLTSFGGNTSNYTTTTEYDYFTSGSLKERTITNVDGSTHNELTYDNKNKQLLTETNTLGQTITYTYEPLGNNVLSIKGITNLTSYAEYDGWFRQTKEISPTGIVTETEFEWAVPNELDNKYTIVDNDLKNWVVYKVNTTAASLPPSTTYYDVLGRPIFTATEGFNGPLYSVTEYNEKGQTKRSFEPYSTNGGNRRYTESVYDDLGRTLTSTLIGGSTYLLTAYAYSYSSGNSKVTITNPDASTSSTTIDATGRTIENTDKMGGNVIYKYYIDANNQTRTETEVLGTLVAKAYFDEGGNQTKLWDKQAGETLYEYYGTGKLKKQTDPNGEVIYFYYEPDGRLDYKTIGGVTYNYTYESGNNGKNKLKELQGPNGNLIKYSYNNLQQLVKKEEYFDNVSYITEHAYDNFGRETKYTYPNGFAVNNIYDAKGYLTSIKDNSGTQIWQLDEMTNIDQVKKYTLGNNKSTSIVYDDNRMLKSVQTTGVDQLLEYNFLPETGNLIDRRRRILSSNDFTDHFTYDDLDRLETYRHEDNNNPSSLPYFANTTDYDDYGKITAKSDAGHPYIHNQGTFRLNEIKNPQPAISPIEQNITYNSFKRPEFISEGDYELTYTYGPDQERIKGVWKNNGQSYRTRIYASNFEINIENGISHEVCYISAPSGLCAMYVTETNNNTLTTSGTDGQFYYTYTDHLGSIISVTNANGNVIARQNFDAWGRRRNAETYSYLPQNTTEIHNGLFSLNALDPYLPVWLFRGYTGHEMLDEFALINMNARLYDPVVGMMLSPDNYVTDATNTQDYNRYTYARNNPLKFRDPDGNNPAVIGGAIVGGVMNVAMNWNTINESSNPLLSGVIAFGIGAATGAIGAYVGVGAAAEFGSSGIISGMTIAAISYLFSAPLKSGLNHAAFGTPTMTNQQFFFGLGTSMVIGGISGGIDAYRHDGKIITGKHAKYGIKYKGGQSNESISSDLSYDKDCFDEITKGNGLCEPAGLRNVYVDGSSSGGVKYDGWKFIEGSKEYSAYVEHLGGGKYDAFFSESCFSSPQELYLSAGHEWMHIDMHYANFAYDVEHGIISEWEYRQSYELGSNNWRDYRSVYLDNKYYNCIPSNNDYKIWGPKIIYSLDY